MMNQTKLPSEHLYGCRPCDGTGVQTRNDGIKIDCPACGGVGSKRPTCSLSKGATEGKACS